MSKIDVDAVLCVSEWLPFHCLALSPCADCSHTRLRVCDDRVWLYADVSIPRADLVHFQDLGKLVLHLVKEAEFDGDKLCVTSSSHDAPTPHFARAIAAARQCNLVSPPPQAAPPS